MPWYTFDNGKTQGTLGSEGGTIARDEEHDGGARITLERGGSIAPYSVTCGVYGWMMHTRFFGTEIEADSEFENMKVALQDIVAAIPFETNPEVEPKSQKVVQAIHQFVETFP